MSLWNNPLIITPRMLIRPLEKIDARELAEATSETWKDLNSWMQWAKNKSELIDIKNCKNYAENCKSKFNLMEEFTFGCFNKENHNFIACIKVAYLKNKENNYEFCGIWCRKRYQEQGLTSEAVNAVMRFFFEVHKANSFTISHSEGNSKSKKMILRLGFLPLCIKPNYILLPNKEKKDAYYYSILSIFDLPNLNVRYSAN